jgi:hypothetical protein
MVAALAAIVVDVDAIFRGALATRVVSVVGDGAGGEVEADVVAGLRIPRLSTK